MATKNSSLTSKWQVTTIMIVTPRTGDRMTTRQLTWAALAVWCAAVLGLGAAGAFVGLPGQPPLPIVAGADAAARHLCRGLPRLARVPRFRALGGTAPGCRAPGVALGR